MKIANYTVDLGHLLGRGAFGDVFVATDENNTQVAVKRVTLKTAATVDIEAEVQILKNIKPHKNILNYIRTEKSTDCLWIFTEYCKEGDLDHYWRTHRLELTHIIDIAYQCACALNHLHTLDPCVVHRDIKPPNILISHDDYHLKVKLADFGISKVSTLMRGTLVMQTICGTPLYMAPEFFLIKKEREEKKFGELAASSYGRSVDIYAMGLVLAELLKATPGRHLTPLIDHGKPIGKVMYELHQVDLPEWCPVNLNDDDSPLVRRLKTVIRAMLRFDQMLRPNAETTMHELKAILDDAPKLGIPRSTGDKKEQATEIVHFLRGTTCKTVRSNQDRSMHPNQDYETLRPNQDDGSLHSNQDYETVCPKKDYEPLRPNQDDGSLHSNQDDGSLHSNQDYETVCPKKDYEPLRPNQDDGSLHSNQDDGSLHSNQDDGSLHSNQDDGSLHSRQDDGIAHHKKGTGTVDSNPDACLNPDNSANPKSNFEAACSKPDNGTVSENQEKEIMYPKPNTQPAHSKPGDKTGQSKYLGQKLVRRVQGHNIRGTVELSKSQAQKVREKMAQGGISRPRGLEYKYVLVGGSRGYNTLDICWELDTPEGEFYWKCFAKFPEVIRGQHGLSVCSIDDNSFAIAGGSNSSKCQSICYKYSVKSKWQKLPDSKIARCSAGLVCLNGVLYYIGGEGDNQTILKDCEKLNLKLVGRRAAWVKCADLFQEMVFPLVATARNSIYVVSNTVNQQETALTLHCFVPEANQWSYRAALPDSIQDTSGAAIVGDGGFLYLLAGREKLCVLYSVEKDSWTILQPCRTVHFFAAACISDGKINVFGGRDERGPSTAISEYDIEKDEWRERTLETPEPIVCHHALVLRMQRVGPVLVEENEDGV